MVIKKEHLTFVITAVVIFSMSMFSASFNHAIASDEYEEGEDTGLVSDEYKEGAETDISYDDITTGTMDEFSKSMIIVDGARYSLCKDVMVYNTANMLIPLNDIETALRVKLFKNKGCIQKIAVFSFAH